MKDYEIEYDEFWKKIIEDENGNINLDQLKRELFDFKKLINNTSIVYMHVTGGTISKPLTPPEAVISIADINYASIYDDDLYTEE